jgi:hypothetical protein
MTLERVVGGSVDYVTVLEPIAEGQQGKIQNVSGARLLPGGAREIDIRTGDGRETVNIGPDNKVAVVDNPSR